MTPLHMALTGLVVWLSWDSIFPPVRAPAPLAEPVDVLVSRPVDQSSAVDVGFLTHGVPLSSATGQGSAAQNYVGGRRQALSFAEQSSGFSSATGQG